MNIRSLIDAIPNAIEDAIDRAFERHDLRVENLVAQVEGLKLSNQQLKAQQFADSESLKCWAKENAELCLKLKLAGGKHASENWRKSSFAGDLTQDRDGLHRDRDAWRKRSLLAEKALASARALNREQAQSRDEPGAYDRVAEASEERDAWAERARLAETGRNNLIKENEERREQIDRLYEDHRRVSAAIAEWDKP